jgi:hypothetical protein
MAPPSFFPAGPPASSRDNTNTDMACSMCVGTLDRPVELGCGKTICLECSTRWLADNSGCPTCKAPLQDHMRPPSQVTMSALSGQLFECDQGCNRTVKAIDYKEHIKSKCQAHFEHSTLSPSRTTVHDLLKKGIDTPTTPTERKVAQHLLKRMMNERSGNDTPLLQVPTRGQVHRVGGCVVNCKRQFSSEFTCTCTANLTDASEGLSCPEFRSLL